MEFAFIIYLFGTVLPLFNWIGEIIVVMTIGTIVIGFATCPFWADDKDTRGLMIAGAKTYLKWAIPIAFICSLAPSKEVSYAMIAAYTAQSIGENEKVQNIAGQSLEVIEAFLEKTKAELKEKETEK